jgi:adenylate kinase family enzyme
VKRVVVIGSGGSGKSTFSKRLGEITGLPVVHLDALFWRPNWTRTPKDEWHETVCREAAREEWIMDGNFGGTRKVRLEAADTIVLLDLPRWLCMYSIVKRTIMYRNRTRPDMAEGCKERLDLEFILWVWNYPTSGRTRTLTDISQLTGKRVEVLKSRAEVDRFLEQVKSEVRASGINA